MTAALAGVLLVIGAGRADAQVTVSRQAEAREIARQKGWIVRQETPTGVIEIKAIVNGVPKYYITHNAVAADSISTDAVLPGGSSGLGLTGSSVILGVWDGGGVRTTHQEFGGRATQMDSPSATHYHSTHVAGTMIASGVVAAAKGMSPSASLRCWDWDNDTTEMANAAAGGLRVSNHSYGFSTGWTYNSSYGEWFWYGDVTVSTVEDNWFGLYTSYSAELDDLAVDYPYYLICKSAGNDRNDDGPGAGGGHYYYNPSSGYWEWSTTTRDPDGDYDSLGSECVAKNILAVGAVEDVVGGYSGTGSVTMSSFSSWGPTDDGRIKPDICGNGVGLYSAIDDSNSSYYDLSGTSMSSPNVSGSMGVLIQHWRSTHPTEGDMRSATLKGLVIHTADETGSANGPDYRFGWGLMNTLKAANTITADVTQSLTISEQTLSSGGSFTLPLTTDGSTPLRVTLSWTDPAGTPPGNLLNPTNAMLVNDLDVRLVRTSPATTFYPWVLNPASPSAAATTGDNSRDNVEQVVVSSPGANSFTLSVTHKGTLSGGSQAFSLIITGASTIGETECDDDDDCSDGLWCTGTETCDDGHCQPGTAPDCSDAFSCTVDSCNDVTDQCDHDLAAGTCLIDDTCYDSGDSNPANDCQACIPATSGSAWTNKSAGSACGDAGNTACDNPDTCDGSGTCLPNLEPGGTECRPAAGICDVAEFCTGSDPDCPTDAFQPSGTPCPDGLFCNGDDTCDANGVCQPGEDPCPGQACRESDDTCVDCVEDGDCDDGVFCNGAETCDGNGTCQPGSDPCPGQICRESDDACIDCLTDEDCDDGNPCNGAETCNEPTGACQAGSCDEEVTVLDAHFDSDANGFAYQDDVFGTSLPNYAAGTYEASGGYAGGGVRVYLGPGSTGGATSGGWSASFTLTEATTVTVNVRHRLLLGAGYETNEYGETILTIDGTRYGNDTNTSLKHMVGNGNGGSTDDSGWLFDEFAISLAAGPHTVIVGAYNNNATYSDEWTEAFFDDVVIIAMYGGQCECDDGLFCNGAETCVGEVCQPGTDPCPGQLCREADDTCVDCLVDGDCDDGQFCNGAETCDPNGSCQPGSDPCPGQLCRESDDTCVECLADADCSDTNTCTTDTCADGTCVHTPVMDGTSCDDGNACNVGETCQAGVCGGGAAPDCSAFNEQCREASCDPAGMEGNCEVLVPFHEGLPCDDGQTCNIGETCQAGACTGGGAPDCSSFDGQCRAASCDPAGTEGNCDIFTPVNEGLPCDDLQFCTIDEVCLAGECTGSENTCDDDVECTVDSCDEQADACVNVPDDEFCANDLFCDGVETCDADLGCLPGEYPCDAGEWCEETGDTCVLHGDGDFDGDADVDLKDFAAFQECFGLAGTGACAAGNLTGTDATIDLDDLTAFVTVLESGGP
ncbi:MAG: S8 family serine peptidase [Phycisphaerae bacterium]|nr:S8 family serine peptidase [Phycisphaerae bacterium]